MSGPYDDIINLPRFQTSHRRMPLYERAAQFAPFAALTGYENLISEEARFTDRRPVPGDEEARIINENLNIISQRRAPTAVRVRCFIPDERKSGGSVVSREGAVRWIDRVMRRMIFTDKSEICIDDIIALDIAEKS